METVEAISESLAGDPEEVRSIPPTPREKAFQRLVGELITEWSHSEWLLMLLFAGLMGIDYDRARMVLASSANFRSKRELLARMGNAYLPDELLPEFRLIMRSVKHLSEKRNMLAHWRMYFIPPSKFRLMNDQDPEMPRTFGRYKDVQIGNLRAWIKEIHLLNGRLYRFSRAMRGQVARQPRLTAEQDSC